MFMCHALRSTTCPVLDLFSHSLSRINRQNRKKLLKISKDSRIKKRQEQLEGQKCIHPKTAVFSHLI